MGPSRRRLAVGLTVAVVLLLALAQVLLPRIAASRVSTRVARYGTVRRVSVDAWPALTLLWGSASSVHITATRLSLSAHALEKLIAQSSGVGTVTITVGSIELGDLRLSRATLMRHGDTLRLQALASRADIVAALPPGVAATLLPSPSEAIDLRASGGALGAHRSIHASVLVVGGKVVVDAVEHASAPLRITLFAAPHIAIESMHAMSRGSPQAGYLVRIAASLR